MRNELQQDLFTSMPQQPVQPSAIERRREAMTTAQAIAELMETAVWQIFNKVPDEITILRGKPDAKPIQIPRRVRSRRVRVCDQPQRVAEEVGLEK